MAHGHSEVAIPNGIGVVSLGLQPGAELQADPSRTSNRGTIFLKFDHTVSRELLPSLMLKLSDSDFEKTKAKSEHPLEIKETFRKDFDGIGLG